MSDVIINVEGVSKSFGGVKANTNTPTSRYCSAIPRAGGWCSTGIV